MPITKRPPNVIYLGGGDGPGGESGMTVVNDYTASVPITPGMQIETFNDSGVLKWRPQDAAADVQSRFFALEEMEWGKGVDDDYGVGDLVKAGHVHPGGTVWGLVPSGQDITIGDYLQSNGDGTFKEATATTAAANVARFRALETLGTVTTLTRCRIEVL